jgi:hypothetical protein
MKFRIDIFRKKITNVDELIKRVRARHQIELDELHYKHTIEINVLTYKHGIALKKLRQLHEIQILEEKY